MQSEVINAVLFAGLPILAITFLLFAYAYFTGFIIPSDDSLDDIEQQFDEMMDDYSEDILQEKEKTKKKPRYFVMEKWFEFGGGYFGLMVLITFLHLEIMEVIDLGATLLSVDGVGAFIETIIQFIIQLVVESIMNVISAFTWWIHWGEKLPIGEGAGMLWIGVSYLGYLAGESLAGFFKK